MSLFGFNATCYLRVGFAPKFAPFQPYHSSAMAAASITLPGEGPLLRRGHAEKGVVRSATSRRSRFDGGSSPAARAVMKVRGYSPRPDRVRHRFFPRWLSCAGRPSYATLFLISANKYTVPACYSTRGSDFSRSAIRRQYLQPCGGVPLPHRAVFVLTRHHYRARLSSNGPINSRLVQSPTACDHTFADGPRASATRY